MPHSDAVEDAGRHGRICITVEETMFRYDDKGWGVIITIERDNAGEIGEEIVEDFRQKLARIERSDVCAIRIEPE